MDAEHAAHHDTKLCWLTLVGTWGLFRYGEKSNDLRSCQGDNKFFEPMMEIDYVKITDC